MQWFALIKVMDVCYVMNHIISHMHAITIVAGLEIIFGDHADILSNISGQTQILTGHGCSRNVHKSHESFRMNKIS